MKKMTREQIQAEIDNIGKQKFAKMSEARLEANERQSDFMKSQMSDNTIKKQLLAGINKPWSEERTKNQIVRTLQVHQREIMTPYGKMGSQLELHEKYKQRFDNYTKKMPHLYYYPEEGPGEPTYEWVYYTPYGKFNKPIMIINAALEQGDLSPEMKDKNAWLSRKLKNDTDNFYKIKEIRRLWS
jgi:hypothetical protein